MERLKINENGRGARAAGRLATLQRLMGEVVSRADLSWRMGFQYGNYRKLYKALGYPEERDLTYQYYYNKYDRQSVATAVIDRPVDATWNGTLKIIEPDTQEHDSTLLKAWQALDERLHVKQTLNKLDKLAGIGQYGVLLFGFNDVNSSNELKKPLGGRNLKLLYLQTYSEKAAIIHKWETDTGSERYGLPLTYKIEAPLPGGTDAREVIVHHSRVLHVAADGLTSEVYGRPRLRPIVNRLEDIEKVLGGDAEMFWRGARPGYHAKPEKNYEFSDVEIEQLEDELDKFEHDLRRVLTSQGVEDIKTLAQQVADPAQHLDVQLQAIAAQTGIPKRILVGSERGELASSEDKGQWLNMIKTRMEEFAEPMILRPLVNMLMKYSVLPKFESYNVMWEDLFAPSEKEKAEVGEIRAKALKAYGDAIGASDVLPPAAALKHLFGFSEEQVEEITRSIEEGIVEEQQQMQSIEEEIQQTEQKI